ncbi:hypothetical protein NZD89_02225 [Alicyclobacillus fastidiosus]|uniref:DUF1129 family protein n=1 Tax=Alicyclobacillus fastidiosus TaxID=392011 RepID=A0ABY6ZHJ0_9BACL|nr:hypothetical protein [Alicyclobacillus fastidiosus]WAH42345.1 hypothetical protein NZD89_02225 [Alicyclobacillus fastidiosus]GMA64153.1 hypothetical protein GCM10025859_45930 [Alicyclobacillus fastidiosus]
MTKIKQIQRSNNKLTRNLTPENRKIMTDMVVYLRVSKISDDRLELIRQDLLDMAMAAQERNESLTEVFGGDYKSFCDEIIANVKPERLKKFVKGLPYLLSTFALLAILNLVSSQYFRQFIHEVKNHSDINYEYPITLGFIVNTVVIFAVAVVIVQLIGKFSFRTDDFLAKFHRLPTMVKFLVGGLLGLAVWGYLFETFTWHNYIIFHINIWVYLAFIVPLFAVWVYYFAFPKSFSGHR